MLRWFGDNMTSDLEQTMADILRDQIDREIKESLIIAYFVDQGWSMVTIGDSDLTDLGWWMEEHIKGGWRGTTTRWVFEDPQDAVLFKMRWA